MKAQAINGNRVDRLLTSKWTKVIFALSVAAFTALNIRNFNTADFVNIPVAFILALFIEFKYKMLAKAFEIKSEKYALISLLITVYTAVEVMLSFTEFGNTYLTKLHNSGWLTKAKLYALSSVAGIFAVFFIFAATYVIVSRLKRIAATSWRKLEKSERVYFFAVVLIFGVFVLACYNLSPAFSSGYNYIHGFDISFFRSDGVLFSGMNYTIKSIFYTAVCFPFTLIALALERMLFFVPVTFLSEYFVQLFHIGLMAASGILLARMVSVKGFSKVCFLSLYSISYSFLIFSIPPEKFILATFCIIFFMYVCVSASKNASIYTQTANYIAALSAAGTLTTSVAVFPFAAYNKSVKEWFINLLKIGCGFLAICVLMGKLSTLVNFMQGLYVELDAFATGVSVGERALQFINAVKSYFIMPDTTIIHAESGVAAESIYAMVRPSVIDWIGVALIVIAIAGFIVNRKMIFAKMSVLWASFSFVVLFIIGWNTTYNEMFLTTLYFGWAFFVLVFMLFEKLFSKLPDNLKGLKYSIYAAAFITMAVINIGGMVDLLKFAVEYHPA